MKHPTYKVESDFNLGMRREFTNLKEARRYACRLINEGWNSRIYNMRTGKLLCIRPKCAHNTMIRNRDESTRRCFPWKCARCGYLYGMP